MGKINFGKSKLSRFLNGKGFYVALALCLIGTGVTAWVAVNSTVDNLSPDAPSVADEVAKPQTDEPVKVPSKAKEENTQWSYPELKPAEKPQTDVPAEKNDLSPSPSSAPKSSSSSSQSAASKDTSNGSGVLPASDSSQKTLYMLPVTGEIINPYSNGELVKSKTLNDWRTHDGIDIKCTAATPVKAVTSGKVSKVYKDGMWGNTVEIEHPNGMTSIYCGLNDDMMVKAGQQVEIGQVLGSVTEKITAEVALETHLHFAMKKGDSYVDPLKTMDKLAETETAAKE